MRTRSRFFWPLLPTFTFAALVSFQVFGPRPIGVADNNDFPKVLGRMGIWVAPEFSADRYRFFVPYYRIDDTRQWHSQIPTTEVCFARVAKWIAKAFLPPGRFDLRILGGLHTVPAAVGVYFCCLAFANSPVKIRLFAAATVVLVFADAEYVQFFNTAYMDAAAMVLFLAVFGIALNIAVARREASLLWTLLFGTAGSVFLGTKLQHASCCLPLVVFCVAIARQASPRRRLIWGGVAGCFVASALYVTLKTPADYRADSQFSVVFNKILPLSNQPVATLAELGRPASEIILSGSNAFSAASPVSKGDYRVDFLRTTGTKKLLTFYIRHPSLTLAILRSDFLRDAPDLPVSNFGLMRRSDQPEPVFRVPLVASLERTAQLSLSSLAVAHSLVLRLFFRMERNGIIQQAAKFEQHCLLVGNCFDSDRRSLVRGGISRRCNRNDAAHSPLPANDGHDDARIAVPTTQRSN